MVRKIALRRVSALLLAAIMLAFLSACKKNRASDASSDSVISSSSQSASPGNQSISSQDTAEDSSSSQGQAVSSQASESGSKTPSAASDGTISDSKEDTSKVKLTNSMIHWLGRSTPNEEAVTLDWSGSGFEINVTGGSVTANIFSLGSNDSNYTWLAVYVNGSRIDKIRLDSGVKRYTLVEGLPTDKATAVRVVKLNEAQQGIAKVRGLEITGKLSAVPAKGRKIVWIGDSITAGFGILGTSSDPFTTETQDITETYGYRISEAFGAEAHFFAASGFGVATSNSGSVSSGLIPPIYPYTEFTSGSTGEAWDFNRFQPDLVVINLGTNDIAGGSKPATLKNGIRTFLTDLRRDHPRATLVWVYGFMINGGAGDIENEVKAFASADKNTYYISAKTISGSGEIGAVGHPNAAAHQRLANTLKTQLADILGW